MINDAFRTIFRKLKLNIDFDGKLNIFQFD